MSSPTSAPTQLTLHLADRALTPILSRSPSTSSSRRQSQTQAQALSSLTAAAITAYDSASRLGLGVPQRIMIETQSCGSMILHSYLNPQSTQRPRSQRTISQGSGRQIVQQANDDLQTLSPRTDTEGTGSADSRREHLVNGIDRDDDQDNDEEEENSGRPPLLIATVVAPMATDAGAARRAAAGLERTGRDFQREWAREQEEAQQTSIDAEGDISSS